MNRIMYSINCYVTKQYNFSPTFFCFFFFFAFLLSIPHHILWNASHQIRIRMMEFTIQIIITKNYHFVTRKCLCAKCVRMCAWVVIGVYISMVYEDRNVEEHHHHQHHHENVILLHVYTNSQRRRRRRNKKPCV